MFAAGCSPQQNFLQP